MTETQENIISDKSVSSDENFLKLIQAAEVEWKPLGEVGEFIRGNGLQKKDFAATGFPAIHYGQIYTKYGLSADKTFTFVADELAEKLRQAGNNDLLIATTSENDEDVCKSVAWLGGKVAISGDMMIFRHQENVKYLMYYFHSDLFQKEKKKYITGTKVRRVSATDMAKLKIPIPPLEIQQKIVEILDKLTDYVTELTTELTHRQKQYAYYRDQLLSFGAETNPLSDSSESLGVEWKALGEIASIFAGGDLPEKYNKGQTEPTEEFPYPIYSNGTGSQSLYGFTDNYRIDKEAVTISARGTLGWHTIRDEKFTPIVRLLTLIPDHEKVTTKYLNYILTQAYLGGVKTGIPSLTKPMVEKIKIPLPALTKQKRIVEILDKFDRLTSDLTEGLPREIALRQKQYAYWREQLLTFKEGSC